jgi:hypothetical protein
MQISRRSDDGAHTSVAAIAGGQLRLVHGAISDEAGSVSFFVNPGHTDWSSTSREIAARNGEELRSLSVPTLRMETLLSRYGTMASR